MTVATYSGAALSRVVQALETKGCRQDGQDWRCPAHEDGRASLSVSDGNGKALVHCHAGCSFESVVAALGLTMSDTFDEPPRMRGLGDPEATYDYTDERGSVLFQVVRFQGKEFRQRRPDPSARNGWVWKVKGCRQVPYHLPQLIAGIAAGRTIYIAEGEKDVEALERAGEVATCNAGGAGKWRLALGEHFHGAAVVVVADKDEPGRKHAEKVTSSLTGIADSVSIVGAKEGKDAADHLAKGHGVVDFVEVSAAESVAIDVETLLASDPPEPPPPRPKATGDRLLDAVRGLDVDCEEPPPPELLEVDGLVGDLARWITDTAPVPQPWLALGSALACVGVLTGRRYAGPSGVRGNLQLVALAPSGAGKDHPRKSVAQLLHAAELTPYLGGSDIASPQGLLAALRAHPARLYQLDEFGHWLETTVGDRAPPHRQALGKLITELFSSADGVHLGTDYGDPKAKPREPVFQPCAGFYCTTTGEQFWEALRGQSTPDGFLARWLLFSTKDRSDGESFEPMPLAQSHESNEPPERLVDRVKLVAQGIPFADYGGNMANVDPMGRDVSPKSVPRAGWSDEADECYQDSQRRWNSFREGRGKAVRAVLKRSAELAQKLALIRAVGRDPAAPAITGADMTWACAVVEWTQASLLGGLERFVGESPYERDLKRLLGVVRDAGREGVTGSALGRACRSIDARLRQTLVKDLQEQGEIVVRKVKTTGRASTVYLTREHDTEQEDS